MATKPITKRYTNVSTEEVFQFVFHCDRCAAPVKSEIYEFNADRFELPLHSPAYALLWTHQHDEAYERANNEARFDFNLCPVCSRRVCNKCFHTTSDAVTDLCVDCRQEQKKQVNHKPFPFGWLKPAKPQNRVLRVGFGEDEQRIVVDARTCAGGTERSL